MDELAAVQQNASAGSARQTPRAKAVLELAAEKAGWGTAVPEGVGRASRSSSPSRLIWRGVAEVEVSRDGAVRVRRVVCALDCGTVVSPDTVQAQIQSAIIFGITAALYGEVTLKEGRVEQTNSILTKSWASMRRRPSKSPSSRVPGRLADGEPGASAIVPAVTTANLCGKRQAPAKAADQYHNVEAAGVNGTPSRCVSSSKR